MKLWRKSALAARSAAEEAAHLLAADAAVQLVYLFGSAVDSTRETVGDVDLAVKRSSAFSAEDILRLRADLISATGAAIDLIDLDRASIVLAHEIADSGRCLFARSAEAKTDFVTRSRSRYWDFKPFLDEQWRLAGERLKERRAGSSS